MYMTQRKNAMWKISLAISEYMANDPMLSRGDAVEEYLREIHYPGINIQYRKKFVEMSLKKYPPCVPVVKTKLLD